MKGNDSRPRLRRVSAALTTILTAAAVFAPAVSALPNATPVRTAAAVAAANPASWPMYLGGPSHSGYQPNETTLNTANAGNLGPGWINQLASGPYGSSPVAANGAVYIGDEGANLHKYNAATGAPIWSVNLRINGIYDTPAVGNHQAFAADLAGFISSVDDMAGTNPKYGTVIWQHRMPNIDVLGAPTLAGDTLYVADSAGNVVAWDATYRTPTSGTVRWQVKLPYCASVGWEASPTVVSGIVYLGTCDGNVVAISPATGSATPTVKTIASFPNGAIRGALASDGARLYAQVEYSPNTTRQIHAVAIDPTATHAVVWDRTLPNPQGASVDVIVANGTVYAPDAYEVAYINSADGGWKGHATSIGVYPTTPAVANGVLYTGGLGYGGGNVGALQAFDATTGGTLYYGGIAGHVANTSPAVANGMVFLGAGNAAGLLYGYHLAVP